jgi:hypothetical protein
MHSYGCIATEGCSWPNFWANVVPFSPVHVGLALPLPVVRGRVVGAAEVEVLVGLPLPAGAQNYYVRLLSGLRAHTKPPYKPDLHRENAKGA